MAVSGKSGADFERAFRTNLDTGICPDTAKSREATPAPALAAKAMAAWIEARTESDGLELAFFVDGKMFDGRFANIGWLQELPDVITKITWDNALLMSGATAAKLGVKSGDMVSLNVAGAPAAGNAAAWIVPGMADDTLGLAVGYGRGEAAGGIAADSGFAASALRTLNAPWLAIGVKASCSHSGSRHC
jgi:molybdopterin-containing oxidoreductase family iron-sulfur binding subunit